MELWCALAEPNILAFVVLLTVVELANVTTLILESFLCIRTTKVIELHALVRRWNRPDRSGEGSVRWEKKVTNERGVNCQSQH